MQLGPKQTDPTNYTMSLRLLKYAFIEDYAEPRYFNTPDELGDRTVLGFDDYMNIVNTGGPEI